jgi:predicted transposase YdaD
VGGELLLSEYISTDKGIRERALSEGMERGIETGMTAGKELNQLENLKNLMANLKITFEEAAKALGLSDADRESLAAKI